jgi:hypothetical protein
MNKAETVATVLEVETNSTIANWLRRVESEPEIIGVKLASEERSAHLSATFRDLAIRLRNSLSSGTRALISDATHDHGLSRREQGYTVAMMIEESRLLQGFDISHIAAQSAETRRCRAAAGRDGDCR